MIRIGVYNNLLAFRQEVQGIYLLDKESREEVLLPNNSIPEGLELGDNIDVFVYKDSEDREVATTTKPYIQLHEFAALDVVDVNRMGAFLNWGLMKDLLLPYGEQTREVKPGDRIVVALTLDFQSERLVATMKVDRILDNEEIDLKEGQEVDIIPYWETELGYNCIVNNQFKGLLYKNEIYQPVNFGDKAKAFVKKVREDKKLDLILDKPGFTVFEDHTQRVLEYLKQHGGFSPINDKSSPEDIKRAFNMSKKAFKKSIGMLYKKRILEIKEDGIHLK